jgi:hypothetical protein
VVVPRLLLPLIFRRRREQLISTESLRRSSPWVGRGQAGYAGYGQDSAEDPTDLYQLLKSHLQVRDWAGTFFVRGGHVVGCVRWCLCCKRGDVVGCKAVPYL